MAEASAVEGLSRRACCQSVSFHLSSSHSHQSAGSAPNLCGPTFAGAFLQPGSQRMGDAHRFPASGWRCSKVSQSGHWPLPRSQVGSRSQPSVANQRSRHSGYQRFRGAGRGPGVAASAGRAAHSTQHFVHQVAVPTGGRRSTAQPDDGAAQPPGSGAGGPDQIQSLSDHCGGHQPGGSDAQSHSTIHRRRRRDLGTNDANRICQIR